MCAKPNLLLRCVKIYHKEYERSESKENVHSCSMFFCPRRKCVSRAQTLEMLFDHFRSVPEKFYTIIPCSLIPAPPPYYPMYTFW